MFQLFIKSIKIKYIKILNKFYKFCVEKNIMHGCFMAQQSDLRSAFTMRGGKKHKLILMNVGKGGYTLVIKHPEEILYHNRKSLVVFLSLPHQAASRERADVMGVNYNKKMYFYAGGGKAGDNAYYYRQNIFITHNAPWIELSFYSTIKKDIDIFSVTMTKRKVTECLSRLFDVLKNKDIQYILYADIDINICDGSSVWYSSMINILSSMGRVLVVSAKNKRNDIIISNVEKKENVTYIYPSTVVFNGSIDPNSAVDIIRMLDCILPNIKQVYVRGIKEASLLVQDRQFSYRLTPYLTNFYEIANGKVHHTDQQINDVNNIAYHAKKFLVQTTEVGNSLKAISEYPIETILFPPPIPDCITVERETQIYDGISIGYAGKITPQWGIIQLLRWAEKLNASGIKIHLTIIANKISAPPNIKSRFIKILESYFAKDFVTYINGLNRLEVMSTLSNMDYIWCYRPKSLEEATLELSTKLVEMVASGKKCLCFPSKINKSILGADYPYYIDNYEDFSKIISSDVDYDMCQYKDKLIAEHGFQPLAQKLKSTLFPQTEYSKTICFAGHDFKFIDAYISTLKAKGYHVIRDVWDWGKAKDQLWHDHSLQTSDILFCEWGLANAVWYSQVNTMKKPLYIRIHLQEINEKARKFGPQIAVNNVTKFIFVSEMVRKKAIEMWGWPEEKTEFIPNFLLDDEYLLSTEKLKNGVHLGMVGIIPSRKRLDRAVELLHQLLQNNIDAHLHIKGHRPEDLAFMHAPGRVKELDYYNEVYKRIESDSQLKAKIEFEPWGNNVAQWYKKIDFILSCSDFESFHYALADGVLSGCIPLVWPWEESNKIYPEGWIVNDVSDAKGRILNIIQDNASISLQLKSNRAFLQRKFGKRNIFDKINALIIGN